jgi:L-rhamnose-H+ transport protein
MLSSPPVIPPNPLLGVSYHSAGAMCAANCYAPQKYIRRWSWETFWMVQASWCWLIWPIVGAIFTIPQLTQVLADAPKDCMVYCLLLGMAYGVGGTAFNVSIRYIGFSLTYAIAVGLSGVLGTVGGPLYDGTLIAKFSKPGAFWVMAGMAIGILGIAMCGVAGRCKELDYQAREGGVGEFSWVKGLTLSLLAGVLSAIYGIACFNVATPIVDVAARHGADIWKGNIAYPFVNTGAFITALLYSLYLARRNRSLGELVRLPADPGGGSLLSPLRNYLLAILTGTLWYGQFFFYNLGHVRMGHYDFTSWGIHMIMLVLFSNVLGVVLWEWKGCRPRTQAAIGFALAVLLASVLMITYGNSCATMVAG